MERIYYIMWFKFRDNYQYLRPVCQLVILCQPGVLDLDFSFDIIGWMAKEKIVRSTGFARSRQLNIEYLCILISIALVHCTLPKIRESFRYNIIYLCPKGMSVNGVEGICLLLC